MRKSAKKKIKPVLFIACEGTSSEYQYFESWGQSEEVLEHFERVEVYPEKTEKKPKTTPYELFLLAKQALDSGSANFAWIVFDKDNHPKLPETFTDAQASNVKIAFSSRSFEEWVLLHFEKNNTAFNATECKDVNNKPTNCGSLISPNCNPVNCLTGHIRRKNFIVNYSKKRTFDLYSSIKKRTDIALINSAWQRFKNGYSLNLQQNMFPFHINPYCDVDQLIYRLNNQSNKVEWGNINQDIVLSDWTINISKQQTYILIKLSHKSDTPELLKEVKSSLFSTNHNYNFNLLNIISENYLIQNNGSTNHVIYKDDLIEFTINIIALPYIAFKREDIAIFIEL
jgi:hypothetical protein